MVRSVSVDSNGIKKGAWSEEEDNKLRAYIQRYGHWNWRLLPKYAGLERCGKSCRLRWTNYLKPGVKRGNFSKQEEELVIECHAEMGNKWSAIAAKLPGRTDNEVKNFWHTRIQKRYKRRNPAEKKKGRSTSAMSSSSSETTPLTATTLSDLASSSAIGDNSPDQLTAELQVFDFWKDPFVADTTDYTTNDYFTQVQDEWSGNSNSSYLSALHSWIPDYGTISNDHSLDGDIF